jgi:Flp pilus assembly protein TadG
MRFVMKSFPPFNLPSALLQADLVRLLRDRSGATAILTGLASTVIIGFAGFGIDIASWEVAQHKMQGAADQAAYSAAVASAAGGTSPTTQAEGIAASFGYVNNTTTTVTVSAGSYAGYSDAFEVTIAQQQPQWFANLFLTSAPTVAARSVAALTNGSACIIALAATGSAMLNVSGSGTVNVQTCDIYVNSSDSKALEVQGGSAALDAKDAYIVGNYCAGSCSGGSTFSVSNTLKTSASAVADPYAGRTAPTVGACGVNPTNSAGGGYNGNYKSPSTATTIYPGVYCGNLTAGGPLTLSSGVYIIDGGQLNVSGGSSSDPVLSSGSCTSSSGKPYINGSNVTIYIVNSGGSQPVAASSCINLSAPSTATNGQNEGIAVWVAAAVPSNKSQFTGGSNVAIKGAIYAPTQEVDYTGSSSATTSCTQIVANNINFTGSAAFQHNCSGTGVSDPSGTGAPKVVQ